jgi:hypothetical protein|tara:strand:+ start:854 stop:1039 length:186 start_codon:yes stop_codon:yes gene_type:complete
VADIHIVQMHTKEKDGAADRLVAAIKSQLYEHSELYKCTVSETIGLLETTKLELWAEQTDG